MNIFKKCTCMNSSSEMIFLVETPFPRAGVLEEINAGSAALSTAQTDGRLPALWFEVKCLGVETAAVCSSASFLHGFGKRS